eukprot:1159134-Pelagomonas_calceolata.AAC.7
MVWHAPDAHAQNVHAQINTRAWVPHAPCRGIDMHAWQQAHERLDAYKREQALKQKQGAAQKKPATKDARLERLAMLLAAAQKCGSASGKAAVQKERRRCKRYGAEQKGRGPYWARSHAPSLKAFCCCNAATKRLSECLGCVLDERNCLGSNANILEQETRLRAILGCQRTPFRSIFSHVTRFTQKLQASTVLQPKLSSTAPPRLLAFYCNQALSKRAHY